MAVFMINSLSQTSFSNPYNVPVSRAKGVATANITPAHQVSSQSNTYSARQESAQYSSYRNTNIRSNVNSDISIQKLEDTVTIVGQNQVNEISVDIQSKKENLWQFAVQQHYINSQKAALNAYVVSATGESFDDSIYSGMNNGRLTDKYMSIVEKTLKQRYVAPEKPDFPETPFKAGGVNIQPRPKTSHQLANQQVINQYNSVQHQGSSSLLHLSA